MSSFLNVRLLVTRVQKISDWFMLGVHLGVPNEELNKIDQRFSASHGVERCKAELFDLWLRRNPSARWDDVASALEQLNEMNLASELRELCRLSPSPCPVATNATPQSASLTQRAQDQEVVRLELSKLAVRQFTLLESKFASLVCKIKTMIVKKGVLPAELHCFLEVRLFQTIEYSTSTTISDLFKSITPYYCFLNTTLLENIIDEFLGEPLQQQLDEYEGLLEEFTSSTKISLLKEIDLKTSVQHKGIPLVVLKLSGHCLDVTIKRFQRLVQYIFGKETSALSNIQVEDGCICITWNTRESAVPSLTAMANQKVLFMKHIGILKLSVGGNTIFKLPVIEEWMFSLENNLMQSVSSSCIEAVEFLLDAGADPCHQDSYGWSVLGKTCTTGDTRMVKMLIEAGASVNLVNEKGSPLMLACSDDIVQLLLQSGADPNFQTKTGQTALLCVDYNRDSSSFGIVKSLLEAGAEVNTQDSKGWSSLALSSKHGSYKIAALLILYGADVQLSTFDKYSPLMTACFYGNEGIAALLLGVHADPNHQGNKKQTALMIACRNQLANTVSLLLSSGADPNLQSDSGWTALMYSFAGHEYDECIPVLLTSSGANPNLQTKVGRTALMVAAQQGYVSNVKMLLNAQAHVNAQDHHGFTALHRLASIGNLPITELLLSAGADPSIANSVGLTPVDVALNSQHHDICQLLLSHSTAAKSIETTDQPQSDLLKPPQDTTLSSSASTTPDQELDQLRFALRHPLPPAGTTKHDAEDIDEYEEKCMIYHK